jgi:hypothetical protein
VKYETNLLTLLCLKEVADLCEFKVIDYAKARFSEEVKRANTPKKAFISAAMLRYLFILSDIKNYCEEVLDGAEIDPERDDPDEPSP